MCHDQAKQKLCSLILLVCFSLCLNGCGNRQKLPDGMPKPYPTEIIIIQDGKPLEGASIALNPAESSNSWYAGGFTDANGKAVLQTLNRYDGVAPGKYYVIVTKRELDTNADITPPDPATDPQGYSKFIEESARIRVPSYDLIDPKYGRISPTGETIDVVAGKNEKSIDVGKAVRQKR